MYSILYFSQICDIESMPPNAVAWQLDDSEFFYVSDLSFPFDVPSVRVDGFIVVCVRALTEMLNSLSLTHCACTR